ncbi:disease resistance protein RPV1-like isoform X2 [Actinidia eriantha]|nr:disease resistance protein RPV1-like isoform X2 [Actinidia eriantha]
MILEHKRASGHVILPVFYDVDPSQVRHQTGSFAEAFGRHERECLRNKVEGWRKALREVANLAGNDLKNDANGHESDFINKIVKVIRAKLDEKVLHVAPYTVGLEYRVEDINSWLQNMSADVGIAMICGMGGIGKTTIAKDIYNSNHERFEGSSFLASIREISERSDGLIRFQRQLLSDILKWKDEDINNVDEGLAMIQKYIGCKRVLVVLDDVDNRYLFDKIIGMHHCFHPGSKIILTTRNKHLLTAHEVCRIFEVEKLRDWESLALFSWHAFKQDQPLEGYVEQSKEVARRCEGLPLALEILGSSLSGKNLDIWESALQKLASIPDSQIMEKLRISYDSLQDDHTRRLFLYIACFFFGEDKDFTLRILDGCEFHTIIGVDNLIDRCLLMINGRNKLMIHQLLRDMAKEIVCQESPKEPGKRSLLWDHKDSLRVLTKKTGTETVEALYLDMHLLKNSRGNSNQIELNTESFARMKYLKLLHLNDVKINGGFNDFPKGLTWLSWHRFSLKSIPSDFPMESLIALDLSHSKLEHVWKGTKLLKSLKILNLSHCHGLANTPNFTVCPNLEDLILEDCMHLVEVHESIVELKKLASLNLQGCKNLKKLPNKFHCLTSLRTLNMSGCSKLDLSADGILINRTGTTCGFESKSWLLKPRKSIYLSLATLVRSLGTLSLRQCNLSSDGLARSLGSLSLLQNLNLSMNPISSIPESIKYLTMLKSLGLESCESLQSLPELPNNLDNLDLRKCSSLQMITNIPNVFTFLRFAMHNCEKLVEIQGIFTSKPIENVNPEIIKHLALNSDELKSRGNLELKFYNYITGITNGPVQVLYECGIYNTLLPKSWFRGLCCDFKRTGSYLSFHVPSHANHKIQALNVYILYEFSRDEGPKLLQDLLPTIENISSTGYIRFPCVSFFGRGYVDISNRSKDLIWRYWPVYNIVPYFDQEWLWSIHWKSGHHVIIEGGDEILVVAEGTNYCKVKEVGVQIVWDVDEENGRQSHTNVDLSPYLVQPGKYFLSNFFDFTSIPKRMSYWDICSDTSTYSRQAFESEDEESEWIDASEDEESECIEWIEDEDEDESGSGDDNDETDDDAAYEVMNPKGISLVDSDEDITKVGFGNIEACSYKNVSIYVELRDEDVIKEDDDIEDLEVDNLKASVKEKGKAIMSKAISKSRQRDPYSADFSASLNSLAESSHNKVKLLEMREKATTASITVSSPDNDDALALFNQCSSILNGLDDLDGLSYSKAMTKLKDDPSWRPIFLEMPEKRKMDWCMSLP